MAELEQLLVVQAHDTATDQLEHRKAHLPLREGLKSVGDQLDAARGELKVALAARSAADATRQKLEAEVAEADQRIADIEARMFGGSVTAARDLESMSTEVAHLKERRSGLEDEALAAIDAADEAAASEAAVEAAIDSLEAEHVRLSADLAVAEDEVDQLIAAERDLRVTAAAEISSELLSRYEAIRSKLGGVGAARLVGDSCSGCHLSLPSGEVERLRKQPADEFSLCDNCQRILVLG